MLCEHSPNLERYYEPGKECVTFETIEDCADKALWYLSHESERARIARCYCERTLREHMWEHRFTDLFRQMGISPKRVRPSDYGVHVSKEMSTKMGLAR